mgnify:CR=1 FL=1
MNKKQAKQFAKDQLEIRDAMLKLVERPYEVDTLTVKNIADAIKYLDDADVPKDNRLYWNPYTNKVEPVR